MPKPLTIRAVLPLLVSVRVCAALSVPTVMLPNWNELLSGVMTGATPVPVSDTVSAVALLLVIARVADRPNEAAGLNVTLIVQLLPAARLAAQVLVWVKSPGFAPV